MVQSSTTTNAAANATVKNDAANATVKNDLPIAFSGGICAIIREITRKANGRITPAEIAQKLKNAGLPVNFGTIARQSSEVRAELGIATTGARKTFTINL